MSNKKYIKYITKSNLVGGTMEQSGIDTYLNINISPVLKEFCDLLNTTKKELLCCQDDIEFMYNTVSKSTPVNYGMLTFYEQLKIQFAKMIDSLPKGSMYTRAVFPKISLDSFISDFDIVLWNDFFLIANGYLTFFLNFNEIIISNNLPFYNFEKTKRPQNCNIVINRNDSYLIFAVQQLTRPIILLNELIKKLDKISYDNKLVNDNIIPNLKSKHEIQSSIVNTINDNVPSSVITENLMKNSIIAKSFNEVKQHTDEEIKKLKKLENEKIQKLIKNHYGDIEFKVQEKKWYQF